LPDDHDYHVVSLNLHGRTIDDLKENFCRVGEQFFGLSFGPGGSSSNGHDVNPTPPAAAETPPGTRRRRSREASAAADPPAQVDDDKPPVRDEVIDKLKQCYSFSPVGAEKVIALQVKMGVKRFNDVPEGKLDELADQANRLWNELHGAPPPPPAPAADTGPF
jgi:hypothetical protein